jgi:hypothetical protein
MLTPLPIFGVLDSIFLAIIVLGGIGIAFELVSGISCMAYLTFVQALKGIFSEPQRKEKYQ